MMHRPRDHARVRGFLNDNGKRTVVSRSSDARSVVLHLFPNTVVLFLAGERLKEDLLITTVCLCEANPDREGSCAMLLIARQ